MYQHEEMRPYFFYIKTSVQMFAFSVVILQSYDYVNKSLVPWNKLSCGKKQLISDQLALVLPR
jgi:hypothetical protein